MLFGLKQAVIEVRKQQKEEETEMMEKFMFHCAEFIQRVWRGHHARARIIPGLKQKKTKTDRINAVCFGWKVRAILKGCRET